MPDFVSYAPSDDALIKTLTDNGVEIIAAPPEQPSWWVSLLGSAIPIIILCGCVLLHYANSRWYGRNEFWQKSC